MAVCNEAAALAAALPPGRARVDPRLTGWVVLEAAVEAAGATQSWQVVVDGLVTDIGKSASIVPGGPGPLLLVGLSIWIC